MTYPIVENGNIAQGFVSIAQYMGLDPKSTVFVNSLITNPKSPVDFKMSDTDGLDWRSAQYVIPLTAAGAHTLAFEVSPLHTSYLKQYIADGDLEMIPAAGRNYPGGSIPAQLSQQFVEGSPLIRKLQGCQIINSYQTDEMAQLSKKMGFTPLVSTEAYLTFLSKAYVHQIASSTSLCTAPGLVLAQPGSIEDYVKAVEDLGKETPLTKIWVKASSLSGGQGIVPIENPTPAKLKAAFNTIAQAYKAAGFFKKEAAAPSDDTPFDGIDFFMPIVVEADIGSIPGNVEVLANACVQAVVTRDKITMVGTSLQETKDGEYVGAKLPKDKEDPAIKAAEAEAVKLLSKMSQDGYVGYAGVDVIVTKSADGEIKPYVLEVNPRLNASTPLLSLVQRTEAATGGKMEGITVTHYLTNLPYQSNEEKTKGIYQIIGEDLFRGAESGYEGIAPIMIDDNDGLKTTFRVAITASTPKKLEELTEGLKKRVQKQDALAKNIRSEV